MINSAKKKYHSDWTHDLTEPQPVYRFRFGIDFIYTEMTSALWAHLRDEYSAFIFHPRSDIRGNGQFIPVLFIKHSESSKMTRLPLHMNIMAVKLNVGEFENQPQVL